MESLLPSEIARLVYGYLVEQDCESAAQLFLESCVHLHECNAIAKEGKKFTSRVMGYTLTDILSHYTDAVCMVNNFNQKKQLASTETRNEIGSEQSKNSEADNVLEDLSTVLLPTGSSENRNKTVFVRISLPPKGKVSESLGKTRKSDGKRNSTETINQDCSSSSKEPEGAVTTVAHNVSSSLDDFDVNMLQTLLDNTALHERIAENINKAMDSNGTVTNIQNNEKKIVEKVLHSTESDPIFEELLHMLAVPRAEDTTTPEDTDKENGDPSENVNVVKEASTIGDQDIMKKLEEENYLAIQGILAGNKKTQKGGALSTNDSLDTSSEGSCGLVLNPNTISSASDLQLLSASPGVKVIGFLPAAASRQLISIPNSTVPVAVRRASRQALRKLAPKPHSSATSTKSPVPSVPSIQNDGKTQETKAPDPAPPLNESIHEEFIVPIAQTTAPKSKSTTEHDNEKSQGTVRPALPSPNEKAIREKLLVRCAKTRGGKVARGSRGCVKALKPQIVISSSDTIKITMTEAPAKRVTRSTNRLFDFDKNSVTSENQGNERLSESPTTQTSDGNLSSGLDESGSKTEGASACSENIKEKENSEDAGSNESSKAKEITDKPASSFNQDQNKLSNKILESKPEGTPAQQMSVIQYKPRVSLSTPRRQSHIRALDFNTPDKSMIEKKSYTSPKEYTKMNKSISDIKNVKRGILTSPELPTPINTVSEQKADLQEKQDNSNKPPGKKKDWDADLRKFVDPENIDIPLSVGLEKVSEKKKAGCKSSNDIRNNKQTVSNKRKRKITKKINVNDKINSENKSSSISPGLQEASSKGVAERVHDKGRKVEKATSISPDRIIEVDELEEAEDLSMKGPAQEKPECEKDFADMAQSKSNDKTPTSGENVAKILADQTIGKNNSSEKILEKDLDLEESSPEKSLEPTKLTGDTNNSEKTQESSLEALQIEGFSMTETPFKENPSLEHMTPTTKLICQLGLAYPGTGSIFSPFGKSDSNLESALITESSRLEEENTRAKVAQDKTKLNEVTGNESERTVSKACLQTDARLSSSNSGLAKDNVAAQLGAFTNSNDLQTPAKCSGPQSIFQIPMEATPVSKAMPAPCDKTPFNKSVSTSSKSVTSGGIPVEATPDFKGRPLSVVDMTPCSKVLSSTNKFLTTELVSMLPPTPKPQEVKSPEKTPDQIKEVMTKSSGLKNDTSKSINISEDTSSSSSNEEDKNSGTCHQGIAKKPVKPPVLKKKTTIIPPKTPRIKLSPKVKKSKKTPAPNRKNRIYSSDSHDSSPEGIPGGKNKLLSAKKNCPAKPATTKKGMKTSTPKPKPALGSSLKKNQKSLPKKGTSLFSIKKQEEEILKECLENCAKAKSRSLFGLMSSDSDSSDSVEIIPPKSNSGLPKLSQGSEKIEIQSKQLKSAHERLKKIKDLSILSSSSSDEDQDTPCPAAHTKDSTKSNSLLSSILNRSGNAPRPKTPLTDLKVDVPKHIANLSESKLLNSPHKLDCSKPYREREESCESFPTLYLSEESNISAITDAQVKPGKSRKSPSVTNDFQGTKKSSVSSEVLNTNVQTRKTEEFCFQKSSSDPSASTSTQNVQNPRIVSSTCDLNSSCNYDKVFQHTPSKNSTKVFSSEDVKLLSRYLNNYEFTFALDGEEGSEVVTKTLKTSPFISLFELNFQEKRDEKRAVTEARRERREPGGGRQGGVGRPRTPLLLAPTPPKNTTSGREPNPGERMRSRGKETGHYSPRYRKRRTSLSSSDEDAKRRKYSHYRSPPRRADWRHPPKNWGREKFIESRYKYEGHHSSVSSSRHQEKSSRWKDHKRSQSPNFHDKRYNHNVSCTSSKSSESGRLMIVDQSLRSSEGPNSPHCSQKLTEKSKRSRNERKEDGEISDSSQPDCRTSNERLLSKEEKWKEIITLVKDDSRTSLLKRVDLDSFLEILHGAEKKS